MNELEKADQEQTYLFDTLSIVTGWSSFTRLETWRIDFRWSQSPRLGVALQSLNAPPPVKESCSLFVCAILSFHLWYVFMYRIVPEGARMMYECVVAPKS